MNPAAQTPGYTRTAIILHWLLALAIVATFALGIYMHELPVSPRRLTLYNWHKWAGISILALSAIRLLWRLAHRAPPDVAMPAWQARAAHAVHGLLYLLFFAVPLSGWAHSSAADFPVVVFGVLPLPDFVGADKALAETLKGVHKLFTLTLGLLVIAHVLGALKHQLIDRDGLLSRMTLRGAARKST